MVRETAKGFFEYTVKVAHVVFLSIGNILAPNAATYASFVSTCPKSSPLKALASCDITDTVSYLKQ